jgi:hypothetical protein
VKFAESIVEHAALDWLAELPIASGIDHALPLPPSEQFTGILWQQR